MPLVKIRGIFVLFQLFFIYLYVLIKAMAIEKPFVHSITAEGDPDPINYNDVFNFRKDIQITSGPTAPLFFIVFSRDENSVGPKEITWKYKNECDRNAEYDILLAIVSKPIQ